jgi:hypothetical protein
MLAHPLTAVPAANIAIKQICLSIMTPCRLIIVFETVACAP